MANTFTQVHMQFVFAVKYRHALITKLWREKLEKFITCLTTERGHKLLSIYAMPDHVHMLVGFRGTQSYSDFMQEIKSISSIWINNEKMTPHFFKWQSGYGAFSYHKTLIPMVCAYIQEQPDHHRVKTSREEYAALLNEFEIEGDRKYIFSEPE